MSPTVVYVHGNGNKARKELLKQEWDRALFGQDMGPSSQVAYWASLLYQTPLADPEFDEAEGLSAPLQERAGPTEIDPPGLLAETLAETRGGGSIAPELEAEAVGEADADRLDGWLQEMAYVADAAMEGGDQAAGAPVREALPLPRAARVAAFRALVKVTFKDVYAYFFGGFREPIRACLRDTLAAATGPVVVIGHSLGSIVAYDVLREPGQAAREVPLFVTVGSPLGVTEIQDLVVRGLQVPAGVATWRNVADGRDLVALDRTIRPEYDPGNRCTDFLVVNDSPNHHGIREYLSSRPVQESVRPLFA
jgi:hypothetical protein